MDLKCWLPLGLPRYIYKKIVACWQLLTKTDNKQFNNLDNV